MNNESRFKLSRENAGNDLVEGHRFGLNRGVEDFQCQKSGRQLTWNGDAEASQIGCGQRAIRDDHRPVAFAPTPSASHERVVLLNVGVGVKTDGSDVEEGLVLCLPIQSLDVRERVRKTIARNSNLIRREAVKHK